MNHLDLEDLITLTAPNPLLSDPDFIQEDIAPINEETSGTSWSNKSDLPVV